MKAVQDLLSVMQLEKVVRGVAARSGYECGAQVTMPGMRTAVETAFQREAFKLLQLINTEKR